MTNQRPLIAGVHSKYALHNKLFNFNTIELPGGFEDGPIIFE
jgi:hypothetical protein